MIPENKVIDFPMVCIGGASVDIGPYTELFGNLNAELGMAIVIVNHMELQNGLLLERLPHFTKMPVVLVEDGMAVQPDHVFVSPEDRDLHVLEGAFRLKRISKPTGWPDVITVFVRSLAKIWRGKLVAVIYSGYDGDCAKALRGFKESGGTVIVQQTSTEEQPDMPLSAIASGYVDFILPIAGIALEIERIALAARGSRANSDLKALAASVGGLKRNAWSRPVVRHLPGEESPGSPLIAVRRV